MPHPSFDITFNNQPVPIKENRMEGLAIKKAAIDAGVAIELDFQLKIRLGNGEWEVVADDRTVTLNKNSVFRAVTPDDNS